MSRTIARLAWIAAAVAASVHGEDWHKIYTVSDQPELRIDAREGSVTVRVWDEKSISARVLASGRTIGPASLEIFERQAGDRVAIDLRMPSQAMDAQRRPILVEMRVPRNTKLEVFTTGGAIHISDISGETRLTSQTGRIECIAVDGFVEARSGGGNITVRGLLDGVRLRTGGGNIDLWLMPGSKLGHGARIETGDGSASLRVPEDFTADLDLKTSGPLTVDLLILGAKRKPRELKGRLNQGGPLIFLRSTHGDVKLQKL